MNVSGMSMTFWDISLLTHLPAGIYLFKVSNRNRTMCEICSELTINTVEHQLERRHSGVSIVKFEQILLILLLLTLTILTRKIQYFSTILNSVQEFLRGCFRPFSYGYTINQVLYIPLSRIKGYRSLKNVTHLIDSEKGMVASFSKC